MKFGVFNYGSWHPSESEEDVFHHCVEQAVLADRLGYDYFFLGEHHFHRHGIMADPMVMASHIAAKTARIRICTAVSVLPWHNPVRLAEQVAMVDILSGGRIELGIGPGYQLREYTGMNVPIDEGRARHAEYLDVMLRAWTDETLVYDGRFYRLTPDDDIQVYPKPIQKPHPPIYCAVVMSPPSIDFAASRGLPLMVHQPNDVVGNTLDVIEQWRTKMLEYGKDPAPFHIPGAKGVYVALTDEEAAADAAGSDPQWVLRNLEKVGSPTGSDADAKPPPGFEFWAYRQQERVKNVENPGRSGIPSLVGSPQTIIAGLEQMRQLGFDKDQEFVFVSPHGWSGLAHSKVMRSIELFGTVVMPAARGTAQSLDRVGPAGKGRRIQKSRSSAANGSDGQRISTPGIAEDS